MEFSFFDVQFIFRINTKQVASNVALRRQVFESKANSESAWRCSSDDKIKEDKYAEPIIKTRSLSAESVKDNDKFCDKLINATNKRERPRPVRENSYLTAVRSSPEAVTLRQKAQSNQRTLSDDDERKTRRTSYLKATASDEFQFTSDTDQASISITPEDEECQQNPKR